MKYRYCITLLVLGLISLTSWAQDGPTTLDDEFTRVMETSNRYKNYKVIKVELLNDLQRSIADTVSGLKATIANNKASIGSLEARIDSLMGTTQELSEELALAKEKENGMVVFGTIIEKGIYQLIVWTIIGLLVLLAIFLFLRYRSSNAITKEVNTKLKEIEAEFDSHRQRSLEREQQLRRKLQDEINKQKE